MIRRVKNWLGIESVKIDLILPPHLPYGKEKLKGVLLLRSPSEQRISKAKVQFIEKYERGRNEEKRINDYLLGAWEMEREMYIPADEKVFLPFQIDVEWQYSDMEQWGQKNRWNAKITDMARLIFQVKSHFRVEASVEVMGAKLQPFYKAEIDVIAP